MKISFEDNPQIGNLIYSLESVVSPTVISIWGASGSGKSTLAEFISTRLPNSRIFPVDRYLSPNLKTAGFNHTNTESKEPYIEGLNPSIWDQQLLNKHLADIVMMKSVHMPIFDHKNRERIGYEEFSPSDITLVEGAYAFENSIEQDISQRILTVTPFHDRFIRKLVRTAYVSMRIDLDESVSRYIKRTEPAANFYYNKYSSSADITIENPSMPMIEFADLVSQNMDETVGDRRYITPREDYGSLHDGESLSVEEPQSDQYIFRYGINNHKLLQFKIGKSTLDLLKAHYVELSTE